MAIYGLNTFWRPSVTTLFVLGKEDFDFDDIKLFQCFCPRLRCDLRQHVHTAVRQLLGYTEGTGICCTEELSKSLSASWCVW